MDKDEMLNIEQKSDGSTKVTLLGRTFEVPSNAYPCNGGTEGVLLADAALSIASAYRSAKQRLEREERQRKLEEVKNKIHPLLWALLEEKGVDMTNVIFKTNEKRVVWFGEMEWLRIELYNDETFRLFYRLSATTLLQIDTDEPNRLLDLSAFWKDVRKCTIEKENHE